MQPVTVMATYEARYEQVPLLEHLLQYQPVLVVAAQWPQRDIRLLRE